MGHSLGALVVFRALRSLASSGHHVRHALLLAGALPAAAAPFAAARAAVTHTLCNLHSPYDHVLRLVYRVLCGEVRWGAAGLGPYPKPPGGHSLAGAYSGVQIAFCQADRGV